MSDLDYKKMYGNVLIKNNMLETKITELIRENNELKKKLEMNITNEIKTNDIINLNSKIENKKISSPKKDNKVKYSDWSCLKCNLMIYGSKNECAKCFSKNPKILLGIESKIIPNVNKKVYRDDWICPIINI